MSERFAGGAVLLVHAHVQAVLGPVNALQLLKVLAGVADVDERSRRGYGRVRHNHHDIGVGGEDIDESSEVGVSHLHALEGGGQFTAAQLELLDDVADLLEPVCVSLLPALVV